jgi:hypothetical protein
MPSDPLLIEIALTPHFQKDLRDLVKRYLTPIEFGIALVLD